MLLHWIYHFQIYSFHPTFW